MGRLSPLIWLAALLLLLPTPVGRALIDVLGGLALVLLALPFILGGLGWIGWKVLQSRMQIVLFLGRTFPKFHKHFAHVNVLILILGIGATFGSVSDLAGYLLSGNELERPLATVEQFTTFVLCLVGFILSVKSFINARNG